MPVHAFIDETKRDAYVLCAVLVETAALAESRRIMRLLKPGNRRRLHLHDEGPTSRRKIIAEFVRTRPIVAAHLWRADMSGRPEREVRDECFRGLVADLLGRDVERLVVESCGQDTQDTQVIANVLAARGAIGRVRFDIVAPSTEPMLWAADLIAWTYAAGGQTRAAVASMIELHPPGR